MHKVVISINGGNVEAIHSDIPDVVVEVFDWDNIRSEREDMEEAEANVYLESREDDYNYMIATLPQILR